MNAFTIFDAQKSTQSYVAAAVEARSISSRRDFQRNLPELATYGLQLRGALQDASFGTLVRMGRTRIELLRSGRRLATSIDKWVRG